MDLEAITNADLEDTWVYNKLLISQLQGIPCGTDSREAAIKGWVIQRPIINLEGMGLGVEKIGLKRHENNIKAGYFWQEILEGEHYSIDYEYGVECLVVKKDFKPSGPPLKFIRTVWVKENPLVDLIQNHFKVPPEIQKVINKYPKANIEFIGGKIIEVHLRENPYFVGHNSDYVVPVTENDTFSIAAEGETFISRPDYGRVGFLIKGELDSPEES